MNKTNQLLIKAIGKTINSTSIVAPKYASKKALNLFATPRKGHYKKSHHKVVSDAVFKTFTTNHLSIATYHWLGSGKTILLAHGWESNASRWKDLLKVLKEKRYNIIAFDGPAHGKSGGQQFSAILHADFIATLCKVFQPEIIIGHSVGGMSTIFCQYKHQFKFVKTIISLGAPAHFEGVFSRYRKMMGYNKRVWKYLNKLVYDKFGYPVEYFSAAEFSKSISAKTLIIHDKYDLIIPYNDALLLHKCFMNSTLISTEGFGHGLKNETVNQHIIEFLENK